MIYNIVDTKYIRNNATCLRVPCFSNAWVLVTFRCIIYQKIDNCNDNTSNIDTRPHIYRKKVMRKQVFHLELRNFAGRMKDEDGYVGEKTEQKIIEASRLSELK